MSEFVPLRAFLEPSVAGAPQLADDARLEVRIDAPQACASDAAASPTSEQTILALGEARRFRAALADAFALAVSELLADLAADVLARELALKPVDLRALAEKVLARFEADLPLRVRAHPDECAHLAALPLAVVADASLRRGDLELDVRGGSIDVSLGARLDAVLRAFEA